MRKLIISLSVLTVLLSVALAGCGDKKDGEVSTTSTTTTTTTRTTTEADKTSKTSDKENLEDKITSALTEMSTMMDE